MRRSAVTYQRERSDFRQPPAGSEGRLWPVPNIGPHALAQKAGSQRGENRAPRCESRIRRGDGNGGRNASDGSDLSIEIKTSDQVAPAMPLSITNVRQATQDDQTHRMAIQNTTQFCVNAQEQGSSFHHPRMLLNGPEPKHPPERRSHSIHTVGRPTEMAGIDRLWQTGCR